MKAQRDPHTGQPLATLTEPVVVQLSEPAMRLVDQLVNSGLYGTSRADAIGILVCEGLGRRLADGIVRRPN